MGKGALTLTGRLALCTLLTFSACVGGWLGSAGFRAWAGGGGVAPVAGDVNGDGALNLTDPIHLLNFLFTGGPAPVECPTRAPGPPRRVLLVRHAQRDANGGADPPLNETGLAQAQKLKSILEGVKIDFVVASTLLRTQQTVQPTAERDPLNVLPIEKFGTTAVDAAVDQLVEYVKARPAGSTTLVAHHSTTLARILRDLGADPAEVARLDFDVYNNLIVLDRQPEGPTVLLPIRGPDTESLPTVLLGARP